ncbi:MAG TPA: ArgE/DapE family deacylase [Gemmatimonadaceae bacterium]|nr:ArgE/DapE family deacylase [Gemmatimonadaceae bacterium]
MTAAGANDRGGDVAELTAALVRADSRNPSLAAGAPGEGEAAGVMANWLRAAGFDVERHDDVAGTDRPNVVARAGRRESGARSLMLNGHLDTVGVDGMTHAPFASERRGALVYGRGAADMKGGLAAMAIGAARAHAAGAIAGEVIVAAVADEEMASAGTRALLARGVRADAAIVGEPTGLAICPAHRGFAWVTVTVHGRAAHGSRYDLGVDAVTGAGLLLAELDAYQHDVLARRPEHPLLGRASLHASLIEGGSGVSTYAERCALTIERRTLPGESGADAVAEVRAAWDRVRQRRPALAASIEAGLAQPPCEVAPDAPVVRSLGAALAAAGEPVRMAGMTAWTDAALLTAAGVPAICFGPGDIGLAHAAEEYVDVGEVERAAWVIERMIGEWCGAR